MMALKLLLLLLITSTILHTSNSISEPTIYTLLETHGLPPGIFPKGISNFTLDPSTSLFHFHLPIPSCDAQFETLFRYDSIVQGRISYAKIEELKGVSAMDLFLWLPVNAVRVDVPASGLIYFHVGAVSKQFSMSYFEDPRDCVASDQKVIQKQPGKDMTENLLSE